MQKSRRDAALPFWEDCKNPGLRPLCGHCPGILLRLAADAAAGRSAPNFMEYKNVCDAAMRLFCIDGGLLLVFHVVFLVEEIVVGEAR